MGKSGISKGTYGAVFAKNGEFLFCNGVRKVRKARLLAGTDGAPRMVEAWAKPIIHSSMLTLGADEKVLIVSNTAGVHHGMKVETGEVQWRSAAIGEGDTGIILPDQSFLFASWDGALQRIDPRDGKAVVTAPRPDHQIRQLQYSPALGCVFYRRIIPADGIRSRPSQSLWRLDVETLEGTEALPLSFDANIAVDPSGKFAVSMTGLAAEAQPSEIGRLDDARSEKVARFDVCLYDLSTWKVMRRRQFLVAKLVVKKLRWSPDSGMICYASSKGFGFLRCCDLEPFAFVPSRFSSDVSFSADANLIFLSDWERSALLSVGDLDGHPFSAA